MKFKNKLKKKHPNIYEHRHDIVFFAFSFLLVLILKSPIINMPFQWDALGYVMPSGLWFKTHSFLSIAMPDYGHPPLLFWILGLTYRIFGITRVVPHLINIIFSFIGVYYTYLLGKHLHSRRTGIIASMLLFFSPLYFAQSGILNTDLPAAAMTVVALYYALRDELKAFIPSAVMLVLFKETGVLLLIALLPYLIYRRYAFKKIAGYMSPFLATAAWLIFYKSKTGEFFYFRHVASMKSVLYSSTYFKTMAVRYFGMLFVSDFNFLLTLIMISALAVYLFRKGRAGLKSEYIPIILLFLLYIIFYSAYNQSLPRHILPLFPLLYLAGARATDFIFKKYSYAVLLLFVILFIIQWSGTRNLACGCDLETNMEYLDLIRTHEQAARFISQNFPDARVLTSWPQIFELGQPEAGYTDIPISVAMPGMPGKSMDMSSNNTVANNFDLIYYSKQANPYLNSRLGQLMQGLDLVLLREFESNNKTAEVYLIVK